MALADHCFGRDRRRLIQIGMKAVSVNDSGGRQCYRDIADTETDIGHAAQQLDSSRTECGHGRSSFILLWWLTICPPCRAEKNWTLRREKSLTKR